MKNLFIFCCIAASFIPAAEAQSNYQSAVGLRAGGGYYDLFAADYKHFFGESPSAIELNFGFRPAYSSFNIFNLSLSATYEYHIATPVEGLQWFLGGGITAYRSFAGYDEARGFGVGIYPTAGVDFRFRGIPLDVFADFRPTFRVSAPNSNEYNAVNFGNLGIGARYVFQ